MSPVRAQGSAAEQPQGGAGARLHRAGVQRPWTPTLSTGGAAAGPPLTARQCPRPRASALASSRPPGPGAAASRLPSLPRAPGARVRTARTAELQAVGGEVAAPDSRGPGSGSGSGAVGQVLHPGQPQLSSTGKRREPPPPRAGPVLREGRADAQRGGGRVGTQRERCPQAPPRGHCAAGLPSPPSVPGGRRGRGTEGAGTRGSWTGASAHTAPGPRACSQARGGTRATQDGASLATGRRAAGKLGPKARAGSSTQERLGRAEVPTEGRRGGRGAGDAGA